MIEGTTIGGLGAGVCVAVAGIGLLPFVRRRLGWNRRSLADDLEDRLADAMGPGVGTHLERPPTVRRIARVDGRSGDEAERPASVPIVRVALGTTDAPGTKLVCEYVAAVLEAIHPVLEERDERVARYDVEFAFGPDGLLVDGECRRVTVAPALADRLLADPEYDAVDLRRDIERADGDDGTSTTLWAECRNDS